MYKLIPKLTLLILIGVKTTSATTWTYIDPISPTQTFSISDTPSKFGINDVDVDARICAKNDAYICIVSADFEFYVPRHINKDSLTWAKGKFKYSAVLNPRLGILGVEDIYEIESVVYKDTIKYLYSTKHGLIGFGGSADKRSRVFLSKTRCGFGSKKYCNNS